LSLNASDVSRSHDAPAFLVRAGRGEAMRLDSLRAALLIRAYLPREFQDDNDCDYAAIAMLANQSGDAG